MNRKSIFKVMLFSFAVIFAVLAVKVYKYFSNDVSVLGIKGESLIALNFQSVNAEIKNPEKHSYLYFKFTVNQKAMLENQFYKNSNAAVNVTLDFKNKKGDKPFAYGFLYDEDFESEKKLKDKIQKRPLITGMFSDFYGTGGKAVLSFTIKENDEVPSGFFVYSMVPAKIEKVQFAQPAVGFDFSGEIPYYGFTKEYSEISGTFFSENKFFDFTSARNVYGSGSEGNSVYPFLEIKLEQEENIGSYNNQTKVKFNYSGENCTIRRVKNKNTVTVQLSAFDSPFGKFASTENGSKIASILLRKNSPELNPDENKKVLFPLVSDIGMVVDWNRKNWRCNDYELFKWENFPDTLLFDFADYKVQNEFFTRLAFFVEKTGYKGTLVSNDFVENQHGYNAHDYKAEDLAAFFNKVRKENFAINEREQLLKEILLANGIILQNEDGSYKEGKGSIISISRESPDYLRWRLLAHESWHGIYFGDEKFRNFVENIYVNFDHASMEFLKIFWETQRGLGYDRNDEYLMKNEFMAYLMQQNLASTSAYFAEDLANRWTVRQNEGELAEYVRSNNGFYFVQAAESLNSYAFENWGLAAGRVNIFSKD